MKYPRKRRFMSDPQYCNHTYFMMNVEVVHILPSSVLDVHNVPKKYTDSIETSFTPFYFSQ